jgi:hypothetical protein
MYVSRVQWSLVKTVINEFLILAEGQILFFTFHFTVTFEAVL